MVLEPKSAKTPNLHSTKNNFGFQTFLAINGKVMLHQVLSKKKAIILLCIGWLYSAAIALFHILMPHAYEGDCFSTPDLFDKIPVTIWALSVIGLIALVAMLHLATYWKLWKRQQMAIGSVISNTGRNRMYKRTMVTSSMVATAFLIGWLPFMISILLDAWSNIDGGNSQHAYKFLSTLSILQSFCNPMIFKLRNRDFKLCVQIRRR